MIISKCVPLAITRKRFSDFTKNCSPEDMIFVGYKNNDDGSKVNVQMRYEHIKEDIIKYIDENGGLGGGGTPDNPPVEDETTITPTPVVANEISFHALTFPEEAGDNATWNEEGQTHVVDLKGELGCVEINAGGDYTCTSVIFARPVIGSVSHVVVDYTGWQNPDTGQFEKPKEEDFILYYGSNQEGYVSYEILRVPPMCRGIVQILHTEETDIIIHSSYSYATDGNTRYIEDYVENYSDDVINDIIDKTPTEDKDEYDIDMGEEKGYIEFVPKEYTSYTFWFKNPEFGQVTYIVIDNTKDYKQDVSIKYGKRMDETNPNDDYSYEVTTVSNERAVIEVFHSLSADIIVNVTKV